MPRRGLGDFSRLHFRAIELATSYQGLALDYISEMFLSEDEGIDLNTVTFEEFTRRFIESNEAGTGDAFEAQLAAQLAPLIDQLLAPPSPEGEPPQGGQQ